MPTDVRTYMDNLVGSNARSREEADCIYKEYQRLREDYLAGKLGKSILVSMQEIRAYLEKNRIRERDSLPNVEDMILLTLAERICDSVKGL